MKHSNLVCRFIERDTLNKLQTKKTRFYYYFVYSFTVSFYTFTTSTRNTYFHADKKIKKLSLGVADGSGEAGKH